MPPDPLDSLRLAVMQELLPLGLAVAERVRRGGVPAVVEGLTQAEDPIGQLREEGEPAARQLRDNLDRLQPGLGNPVLKVQVRDLDPPAAEATPVAVPAEQDQQELQRALARIGEHLALLEQRLEPER